MIKVISFDLDGTLVKSTYANSVWLEGLPKLYAKEKNLPLEDVKKYIFKEYEKVGENRKEWYDIDWWFKHFNLNFDWQNLLDEYRYTVEIYPDTKKVLKKLSKKFDLIIISNAKREFIDIQVNETKIKPYFSHIFSSISDFDTVKKKPSVYKQICDKINIKPDEMIHVGDSKEFDYESPRKLGIKSIYINREKEIKNKDIINSLNDLTNIL